MKVLEGAVAAPNAKIAVVIARFNSFINESLLEGAVDALKRIGQVKDENITIVRAPGAYELPLVARRLAESKKFDAIVALGTVIRGGTAHFEYVAGEASSGLGQVAMQAEIPVAFGVLTTENIEQAIERAGTNAGATLSNTPLMYLWLSSAPNTFATSIASLIATLYGTSGSN